MHSVNARRQAFKISLATGLLCTSVASLAADPLPVMASFSILGDLVRVVGGERVTVSTLVGPDEDAHVFQPKPSDAKNLLQARLLVVNGLGFEPWAQKLSRAAGYKGTTVIASQGVAVRSMPANSSHAHADPHAWQNPTLVVLYVRNIAAALGQLDPAGAATYQSRSEAYAADLQALDAFATAQFAPLTASQRQVITSHDAFGYFGARYGIRFLAPQGLSTDTEPSAQQVAQLVRQIRREKIRAVFIENMSNPKLLAQLSRDAGATVGPALYVDALSAPSGPAGSYLQLMRHNITTLARGMANNQRP
ncbi:MAG: metal ABC transporter substrate-binding protein [Polaromonas sp.]